MIKLTIITLAYNQEKFIKQALDGFLIQKVNFEFEVLIHDDASTDNTKKIITEYAEKYPDIIKPILETENQYSKGDFTFVNSMFEMAKGEYIALCEGDDFWTDPLKLSKQVSFLDKHKDYSVCFHASKVLYEDIDKESYVYPDVMDTSWYTLEELIRINFIPTNSVMYRKQDYKKYAKNIMPGDWYTHLYHAQFGKIKYIDEVMSVYRKHQGGVFWDYDQERDKIWIKHGLDYVKFYRELLSIYKKQPKIILEVKQLLYEHLNTLVGIDSRYGVKTMVEVFDTFPDEIQPFILHQYNKIKLLQDEKDKLTAEFLKAGDRRYEYEVLADKYKHELEVLKSEHSEVLNELEHMRSTNVWKARQKAVKIARSLKKKS